MTLISATHGVNEFFSIAIPPIIPFLVADLDITYTEGGLLLTVFFVMYSVFQLPAGVIADRIGKKRLLVGGLIGMVLGLYLASMADSYEALVASQVIAGISGSTYHPTGMSLISDFETGSTEGKAMGVFGFFGMAGVAGAPLVIGGLAGVLDWRFGLAVAATLGLVFTLVFAVLFSEPESRSPDVAGSDTGPTSADADDRALDDRDVGDGTAPGSRSTIERLRAGVTGVLRVPLTATVLLLLVMTVLVSLQTRAIMTFTTSYVADTTGGTATLGNAVFFVMLVSGSVSSLWAGSLADRVHRGLLGVGVSVATAVLLVVTYLLVSGSGALPEELLVGALVVLFFVIGLAMYACVPVKNAIISSEAEREFSGSLFGLTQTSSAVGSASGPAVFGFLATEFGLAIAYPLIGSVSLLIGAAFLLLSRDT
ncbi:MFS transporter [Halorubrum sp. DTA98]|uniref:MFS transporter n=1 Tax=Halorubrum sp. DTA98 TaxID=3402163 RepID=UPI003AAA3DC6